MTPLRQIDALIEEEKLLHAAQLIRQLQIEDRESLSKKYHAVLSTADALAAFVKDLCGPISEDGWMKVRTEKCGIHKTLIFYKVNEEYQMFCRLETPIEASLLMPLMSVLNETELFDTWVPSWSVPFRLRLDTSKRLARDGRADQTIQFVASVPWPFSQREGIIRAVAVDDIDSDQSSIAVHISSVKEGPTIPAPSTTSRVRIDFDGAMLFRTCPADHELLATNDIGAPKVLASFKM